VLRVVSASAQLLGNVTAAVAMNVAIAARETDPITERNDRGRPA
jgi:hypothetical protein